MSYKLADVIWNDDGTMATELTPLEALERIAQEKAIHNGLMIKNYTKFSKEFDIIKKELMALEIIKELPNEEKQVLLNAIYTYTKSEEKYDLLKEELL